MMVNTWGVDRFSCALLHFLLPSNTEVWWCGCPGRDTLPAPTAHRHLTLSDRAAGSRMLISALQNHLPVPHDPWPSTSQTSNSRHASAERPVMQSLQLTKDDAATTAPALVPAEAGIHGWGGLIAPCAHAICLVSASLKEACAQANGSQGQQSPDTLHSL